MRRQRGATLLEALVAFLVLSLGMLTVARVQTQLRLNSDIARQRSEAVRLAQQDMETLRAFSVLQATAGARSYADISSANNTVDLSTGYQTNTRYLVSRKVDAGGTPNAKNTSVNVSWTDHAGTTQQVVLNSVIAGSNPAYSGALGVAPSRAPVKGAYARSARIPLTAKDLGNGSSALKPVSSGGVALVFNNLSGEVTARCAGINPGAATKDLSAADLTSCDATMGYLLSGSVRFSSTAPPNAGQASEAPLPLAVALSVTGGNYDNPPWCASEPIQTDAGDRFVAYHCVVYPPSNAAQWSGRADLVPTGWTIGTGPNERRVCRYSADLDGSGAVDTNVEHPASYTRVTGTLVNQNFLVIAGTENCPLGSALKFEGKSTDVFVDLSTAQHQP
jgi:Tfp pilus assembly protein PilV